ncbi:TIGR01777 family oxidoreductase [Streptomyces sp. WMMC905]|uniref:TIGR01777 family oxidoreductase n=1 Tax=Streptomyces sp. WMMC905 TaxID=3404123 RepID=UPI003B955EBA
MAASRIAVAGASGLIGSALVRSLADDGHEVARLVRRPPESPDEVRWDPERGEVDTDALAGCEAVVNLAGAGIADRPWTRERKAVLRDSRVRGTDALARAAATLEPRPRVFLNGSAIGYYGDTGDLAVDEGAPAGEGFLASLCVDWEAAAAPAAEAGIRTAYARTGLVVSKAGGAWGRLFPIFRSGLGGRLGSGRQYWSFVSLHDEVAALRHLLDHDDLSGPFNITAPEPLTNREITAAMGRVMGKPTVLAVPAPVLRALLGEVSREVVGSVRVLPTRLLEAGFHFSYPGIEEAILAALREG